MLDGRDLELGAPDHAHHLGDLHAHLEGLREGRMVFIELDDLADLRLAQTRDLFTQLLNGVKELRVADPVLFTQPANFQLALGAEFLARLMICHRFSPAVPLDDRMLGTLPKVGKYRIKIKIP